MRVRLHGLVGACGLLLLVETGLLLTATPNLWPSSSQFFATSPAEDVLQHTVGTARVGDGACTSLTTLPADIGILPDDNVIYGISQLAVYDPAIPKRYFEAWSERTGTPATSNGLGMFCPTLRSGALARHFGVSYVLEPDSAPPAEGMDLVEHVGDEYLLRVPGGGVATSERQGQPPDSPSAQVIPVSYPKPSSIEVRTSSRAPTTLFLHVTDDPGWHADVDGHAVPLQEWSGLMMKVELMPGRHVVTVTYMPDSFLLGLGFALVALFALSGWIVLEARSASRVDAPKTTS